MALDARRDASEAGAISMVLIVADLGAQHAAVTADVNVSCHSDLLRKRENEFDGAIGLGVGVDGEVEAAVTDVARFAALFGNGVTLGEAHLYGKRHRKSPRGPALLTVLHGALPNPAGPKLSSLEIGCNGFR